MGFFKSTVHVVTLLCAEGLGFSQVPSPPPSRPVQVQSTPVDAESEKHGILKLADDKATIAGLYDPSKKILLVGNMHVLGDMQDEMTRNLSGLHAKGINNLAEECAPENQIEIDKYISGKMSREDLLAYFKKIYIKGLDIGKRAEMLDEALRLKMKFFCVDTLEYDGSVPVPAELQDKANGYTALNEKMNQEQDPQQKLMLRLQLSGIELSVRQFNRAARTHYRNGVMASRLGNISENNGPVAMFVGSEHIGSAKEAEPGLPTGIRPNTVETELKQLPTAPAAMSIALSGGNFVGAYTSDELGDVCSGSTLIEECWAQTNGRANDRYVRPGAGDATYILHLPQRLPATNRDRKPQR